MQKWDNPKTEELIKAFLTLENIREAKLFLRDLLTEKELLELGNRWKAAQMLNNKLSYVKITEKTGLSSTTVARISRWINDGMGGYRLMLKKISKNHPGTLPRLRKG